ncbi:S8 family serine peptidase [Brevibacillus daliensis]|uniref:S8 family serine peptidase n=1 Tax=Brevibacillus daliensis TaxID=2892995 RepID=UPI001E4D2ABD|nr:S8 family serine peptidase [Brevibacillus daliensis]
MLYPQLQKGLIWITAIAVVLCTVITGEASVVYAAVKPNDYYFPNQTHLDIINAPEAWSLVKGNPAIKIALLDSGVDQDHPDLKDNMLPTINLVPGESADDLNGHGTQVAGILAAKGNNGIGVTGVLWDAKILPIKVLDRNGEASSERLASGIRRAVAEGAKVILMSASTLYYSKELEDAVNLAESRGIVVIAASGNEGSRVNYPAAFPTVVAVGAVTNNNKVHNRSNFGPELNIVAPGLDIFTTARSNRYSSMRGTSAAAPQVAGAAALLLAKNPSMKPIDVRQQLYHSATKINGVRWTKETGYGVLHVGRALKLTPTGDINEPNNSMSKAAAFPMDNQIRGQISASDPNDWFYTDIPYDGSLVINTQLNTNFRGALAITVYQDGKVQDTYSLSNNSSLTIPVKKGKVHHNLRGAGVSNVNYTITSKFNIAPDRYEPNNTMEAIRPLPAGNRIEVKGNFHTANDVDWYSYYVRDTGKMFIQVDTDTLRLDPQISVRKEGNAKGYFLDASTPTDTTEKVNIDVTPGRYLFKLQNSFPAAVNGEYFMQLHYMPQRKDTNEPNDNPRLATKLGGGTTNLLTGTIPSQSDTDWFTFTISNESYVTIRAPYIPPQATVRLAVYNSRNMDYSIDARNASGEDNEVVFEDKLAPGTYYIKISSTTPFFYDAYRFSMTRQDMVSGFRDIGQHWAKPAISKLASNGIVSAPSNQLFRPDANTTRAEFADMLIRTLRAKGLSTGSVGSNPYKDLNGRHWAYNSLLQASSLGIMNGANKKIEPDRSVTRAEMALMIARAKNLSTYTRTSISFKDVPSTHWGAAAIETLAAHGWLKGYNDGKFYPDRAVLRGETSTVLTKAFQL